MNVSVESLAPCKKLVRVEVEAQQGDETFNTITKDFQRQASLPGFRPGKAPRDMVLRKYEKDITDEVKRKLISDSYLDVMKAEEMWRTSTGDGVTVAVIDSGVDPEPDLEGQVLPGVAALTDK